MQTTNQIVDQLTSWLYPASVFTRLSNFSRSKSPPPIIISFFATLALIILAQLYGSLILGSAIAIEFNVSPGNAALVHSAFGIAYAIGFLFWGVIVDRFGAQPVFIVGLAILLAATLLVAFAPDIWWLLIARIIQGAAAACFAPAAFSYFGMNLPASTRAIAITVLTSSFLATAVLGQVTAQIVLATSTWRWFFGFSTILLAAGLAFALHILQPSSHPTTPKSSAIFIYVRLLRNPRIISILALSLLILGPFIALYAALGQTGHYSQAALLSLRLSALPALIWAGLASAWLIKIPAERRLIVGFIGAMFASTILICLTTSPLGVGIGMFLLAGAVSVLAPATLQVLTTLAPQHYGSVTALYTFVLFLGASLAPLAIQSLATSVEPEELVQITAAIAVFIFATAVAISLVATYGSKRRKASTKQQIARSKGKPCQKQSTQH